MSADGCGAPVGGASLNGVEVGSQAIVQGTVRRGSEPVAGAYVRLLDASGEFTAEVPTGSEGQFRFFAAPGEWTLRTLAPRSAPVDRTVVASRGAIAEVEVALA